LTQQYIISQRADNPIKNLASLTRTDVGTPRKHYTIFRLTGNVEKTIFSSERDRKLTPSLAAAVAVVLVV
jgi:hypothetical protein